MDILKLKNLCEKCEKCELSKTRNKVVFGEGPSNSRIIFVSEAPGQEENKTGKPFVGKSGQLLNKLFNETNINRKEIYITNIVKCNPPQNRNPLPEERKICINYLKYEYNIIKPKIIICLGKVAAQELIRDNFKITRERGIWYKRDDYMIMATFHPSYLLRNPNAANDVINDFIEIKKALDKIKTE
jgi:DNA polymerase